MIIVIRRYFFSLCVLFARWRTRDESSSEKRGIFSRAIERAHDRDELYYSLDMQILALSSTVVSVCDRKAVVHEKINPNTRVGQRRRYRESAIDWIYSCTNDVYDALERWMDRPACLFLPPRVEGEHNGESCSRIDPHSLTRPVTSLQKLSAPRCAHPPLREARLRITPAFSAEARGQPQ